MSIPPTRTTSLRSVAARMGESFYLGWMAQVSIASNFDYNLIPFYFCSFYVECISSWGEEAFPSRQDWTNTWSPRLTWSPLRLHQILRRLLLILSLDFSLGCERLDRLKLHPWQCWLRQHVILLLFHQIDNTRVSLSMSLYNLRLSSRLDFSEHLPQDDCKFLLKILIIVWLIPFSLVQIQM